MINIENHGNRGFRWCLIRYLNPVNKNPEKIRNVHNEFAKQLKFKGINFPAHKSVQIEKQSNISINLFGYEYEIPYSIYTSKQKHVDLLLLSNSKNSHHVLIKDFNIHTTDKTKHHGKKHFC